ncbi:membrane protein [Amylibacter marinus]|uniref:Membrane protein n=1 Tax=Amylibacter marinus TaxID=1475483 RepID=A0ABQ5VWW5_9RHOB|nr:DMT family transporter [Amylibacter marinus]GLQ35755.1 membrane protein [Amylibacter marinus]
MNDQTKGILLAILGVLFIVPDSLFIRLISADAYTIIVWRNFFSGAFIFTGLLAYHRGNLWRIYAGTGRNALMFCLFLACSAPLFTLAVSLTTVANVVFIAATTPVFAAFASWVLTGQRISSRMAITIAAALCGVGIIASGSHETEGATLRGDLTAVAFAASYGTALSFAAQSKATSMVPMTPIALFASGLVFLPFATPFVFQGMDAPYVLAHNIFIAVAISLLAISPRFITSTEVALFLLCESVLAPLLVWVVIGETLGRATVIGGTIVLGALLVSNIIALRNRPATPD